MQRFFSSLAEIEQFTLALRWNQKLLACQHCNKHDQWVSHGFCYKALSMNEAQIVGKRIPCSNRFGRSGCGHTFRLYCPDRTPLLVYSLSCCITFLSCLLRGSRCSIESAYRQATGATCARHAWRWLGKLRRKLPAFRTFLLPRLADTSVSAPIASASPLLTTLAQLIDLFSHEAGATFQIATQNAFL